MSKGEYSTFWYSFIIPEGVDISLIHSEECSLANISKTKALEFLQDNLVLSSLPVSENLPSEDADMFLNME